MCFDSPRFGNSTVSFVEPDTAYIQRNVDE